MTVNHYYYKLYYLNLFKLISMQTVEKCAYHESGRIVMSYSLGYSCDSSQLSQTDSNQGQTRINGGDDLPGIQQILQRSSTLAIAENTPRLIEIANKLLKMYCAGTCTSLYYENNKVLNSEMEIVFPGQDISQIELIQSFLSKHDPDFNEENFPALLNQVFKQIQQAEFCKAVDMLVLRYLSNAEFKLSRFEIEDTIRASGLTLPIRKVQAGFAVSLSEDTSPSPKPTKHQESTSSSNEIIDHSILDGILGNFITSLNKNMSQTEVNAGISFLKDVFKKFQ